MKTRIPFLYKTIFATVFLFSCGSNQKSDDTESTGTADSLTEQKDSTAYIDLLHYMRLHNGEFVTDYGGDPEVGKTTRNDLKKTFEAIKNTPGQPVVIHFHGGLVRVKKAASEPLTNGINQMYADAGAFPYYIIYGGGIGEMAGINLKSGYDNMLTQIVFEYTKSRVFKYLFVSLKDFLGNDASLKNNRPFFGENSLYIDTTQLDQVYENNLGKMDLQEEVAMTNKFLINTDQELAEYEKAFEERMENDPVFENLCKRELEPALVANDTLTEKLAARVPFAKLLKVGVIAYQVLKRKRDHRDHKWEPTIFEEIVENSGGIIFVALKHGVRGVWKTQKEVTDQTAFGADPEKAGGRALLEELYNNASDRDIYLVGSSTGAVFICNMLRYAAMDPRYKTLRFKIIFSVPACTFEQFNHTLETAGNLIADIRIFALNDQHEKKDNLIKLHPYNPAGLGKIPLYNASVLYFVSGMAETNPDKKKFYNNDLPILGMQRFHNDDFLSRSKISDHERDIIRKVKKYLKSGQPDSYIVWSTDEASHTPGKDNTGFTHELVIRDKNVQQSILYIIKNDFDRKTPQ